MTSTLHFISLFRQAFGPNALLPLVYSYTERPLAHTPKIGGCFFKALPHVMDGGTLSLNADNIGCGGGKFYTGFTPMPERVPTFVSLKERYKQTPEMVARFVADIDVQQAPAPWLNLMRVDGVETLDQIEGMVFLATPDELSGLCGWAFYDNNSPEAVTTLFGSGCSTMLANTTTENRRGGSRCFLGLLDPSVRPHIPAGRLGFAIPRSRLDGMMATMGQCFLGGAPAWKKVRARLDQATGEE